jgi:hypothetical protein
MVSLWRKLYLFIPEHVAINSLPMVKVDYKQHRFHKRTNHWVILIQLPVCQIDAAIERLHKQRILVLPRCKVDQ